MHRPACLDRFGLFGDLVIDCQDSIEERGYVRQFVHDKRIDHKEYIRKYGDDMPEVRDWKWSHS